ncbi:Plastocyanin-like domain [Musa troglodytarum]|uniref:Plastocyanin-like domain n=1 Tax=Musa troglodytarum TaxID=320322 RepID=A0A9E7F8D6_9LILI|nr:Plastocyanin-like domain [Musa troglodytarum]
MGAERWPIQLQLAVVATACIGCSLAHQHLVGDSIWSIPPSNEFYSNWASNRSFAVGDDLVFRFELGFYDVVQVSRREFDSCSADNAFRSFLVGPATVSLNEEGVFYFLCSFGNYCLLGQKLSVTVQRLLPPTGASPSSTPPASRPHRK